MKTDTIAIGTLVQTPDGPKRVIGTLRIGPHVTVVHEDQVRPLTHEEYEDQVRPLTHEEAQARPKDLADTVIWGS
jgi:hypothetical protein